MSDNGSIFSLPVHVPPPANSNGNGHQPPETLTRDDLPDPASLRPADLHALRLYAVGEAYDRLLPLINSQLVALFSAQADPIALIDALGPAIREAVFRLDPHHLPPLELTSADLCQLLDRSADQAAAKTAAMQFILAAAQLNLTDLLALTTHMHSRAKFSQDFVRKWERAVKEQRNRLSAERQAQEAARLVELTAHKQAESASWPYMEHNGRMHLAAIDPRTDAIVLRPIADFTAQISETILPEHGYPIHRVTGTTCSGEPLEVEVEAGDFQDIKKLTAALSRAIARDPRAGIEVGMSQHLPKAIHALTRPDVPTTALYHRTGWAAGKFLVPGRDLPDTRIELPGGSPYAFTPDADLDQGLAALQHLIASVGPQNSLPALMPFFSAPLADRLGLRDERYVTLIRGRTGQFKTSWSQTAMCLYGPDFAAERHLVKWGDGATTNAIEALAGEAHDLPFLLDNYKPNTGDGEAGLIKFIHRMAEGGGRRRLDRNADLKPTAEIYSWLIMTGEDAPQTDMATTARMLWVSFDDQPADAAAQLGQAQLSSAHLCAVGQHWIEWLESPDAQPIIQTMRDKFPILRQQYLELILKLNPEAIQGNPRRLAQNLAVNQLTWEILRRCPAIGPCVDLKDAYETGLGAVLQAMALSSVQSNPGMVFIQALRELLSSGQALLVDPDLAPPPLLNEPGTPLPPLPPPVPGIVGTFDINRGDVARRVIGYVGANGDAYLFPVLARRVVEDLVGGAALAQVTTTALYKRLDELGYLSSKGKDGTLLPKKINGKVERVLHLTARALDLGLEAGRPKPAADER
ncbi:MAG: hypothetical protein ACYDBJ_06150 [Aggregatilineales bacterium]